uniref:F-box domain-containing protein n=1 Tax=Leersia perrieri TaxID=77586 RepID=A0A0D9W5B9_9ORYZ
MADQTETTLPASSSCSSRNPARVSRGGEGSEGLGALPDDILHTILSKLTTRQAVRTTVLSRRWRHLWRSTPCVDVDAREFHGSWATLEAFTANLLLTSSSHHTAPPVLDAFRLRGLLGLMLIHYRHRAIVDTFVRRGITHRPAALEIDLGYSSYNYFALPRLAPPSSATSSRLKRLHLACVVLEASFADDIRSGGCPVLEEVELRRCKCDFYELSSATLRRLDMEACFWVCRDRVVSVVAPRLASLRLAISDGMWKGLVLESGGESLTQVSISGTFNLVNLFRNLRVMANVTRNKLIKQHIDLKAEEPEDRFLIADKIPPL